MEDFGTLPDHSQGSAHASSSQEHAQNQTDVAETPVKASTHKRRSSAFSDYTASPELRERSSIPTLSTAKLNFAGNANEALNAEPIPIDPISNGAGLNSMPSQPHQDQLENQKPSKPIKPKLNPIVHHEDRVTGGEERTRTLGSPLELQGRGPSNRSLDGFELAGLVDGSSSIWTDENERVQSVPFMVRQKFC